MTNFEGGKDIVFFDGNCLFCNRWVRAVMRRDKKRALLFAPRRGETYSKISIDGIKELEEVDSIIFLKNPSKDLDQGTLFSRSSATGEILKGLGGFWKIIGSLLLLCPRALRDFGYGIVSRNRIKWFGKTDEFCELPKQEDATRLLP